MISPSIPIEEPLVTLEESSTRYADVYFIWKTKTNCDTNCTSGIGNHKVHFTIKFSSTFSVNLIWFYSLTVLTIWSVTWCHYIFWWLDKYFHETCDLFERLDCVWVKININPVILFKILLSFVLCFGERNGTESYNYLDIVRNENIMIA